MKAFAISTLLAFLPFMGKGQCPSDKGQIDVAVSYGFIASDVALQSLTTNSSTLGNKNITYNPGIPFITLRYFLFNRLAIALAGGVNNERGQYTGFYDPSFISGTYKQSTTTVAFELYYIYVFRKYFEAYTLAGVGPAVTSTETTTTATGGTPTSTATTVQNTLKGQYTPIGVRVGGRLGAFAELGIGYKGIFNVGVSCKLGPSCWWHEGQ